MARTGQAGNTGAAINAHLRIDIGALLIGVEALYGAHRDALGKAAELAIVCDDVRHSPSLPLHVLRWG